MPQTTAAPETKHLRVPLDVKAIDNDARTFEGYLATWQLDLGGDVIHRGAFKRTLDHWRSSGKSLPLIDNHRYDSVFASVGKLLEASEEDAGLWTKWAVVDSPMGDELMARLRSGIVDSLSIGYRAVKAEPPSDAERDRGIERHLKELELREGSTVLFPMNEAALIDVESVKARLQKDDLSDTDRKELEKLRDDIDAALQSASEKDSPDGLAPEDPLRLEAAATLRDLKLRRLATRHGGPARTERRRAG